MLTVVTGTLGATAASWLGSKVRYEVLVRFDDGIDRGYRVDAPPAFRPGARVRVTDGALESAARELRDARAQLARRLREEVARSGAAARAAAEARAQVRGMGGGAVPLGVGGRGTGPVRPLPPPSLALSRGRGRGPPGKSKSERARGKERANEFMASLGRAG